MASMHAFVAVAFLSPSKRSDLLHSHVHFRNHSLVLTLRLFPNERSPSSIVGNAGTKERKICTNPVQLSVGNLGI